jgi:hypothetical protein
MTSVPSVLYLVSEGDGVSHYCGHNDHACLLASNNHQRIKQNRDYARSGFVHYNPAVLTWRAVVISVIPLLWSHKSSKVAAQLTGIAQSV